MNTAEFQLISLLGLGVALGATLFLTQFGFASGYRSLLLHGDASAIRPQLLLLGLTTVFFAAVLANPSLFGSSISGAVAPAGPAVAIGAFAFGIGMQLAGGCGSGSLYSAGSGNIRMLIVLIAFCIGGLQASVHMGGWQQLPIWETRSLSEIFGWLGAVLIQLTILFSIWSLLTYLSRGQLSINSKREQQLFVGAAILAGLSSLVLLVASQPWSITWGFTLWGAKLAQSMGYLLDGIPFWQGRFQGNALNNSLVQDITSLMNIGILMGAAGAAILTRKFKFTFPGSMTSVFASLIGGFLMGYGARISFGCNIGAFVSGIASTSLHGWLWIAAAIPGNYVGVKLRPFFRLI